MTKNQQHGKRFEDIVKGSSFFRGASDSARSSTASFDVEAKFDRTLGIPTSIKSGKGRGVALSDARRFWAINQEFRLLFGRYRQKGDEKEFYEIHEFILSPTALANLRGALTAPQIGAFHTGLSLTNFPRGKHPEARAWARQEKSKLKQYVTCIALNPKIDSKGQRRLQCSVPVQSLIDVTNSGTTYFKHTDSFGDIKLPITLISSSREFVKGQR